MTKTTDNLTTDPMTGEPWTLCTPRVTTTNEAHTLPNGKKTFARCGGCHKPVTVNDKGVWVYA